MSNKTSEFRNIIEQAYNHCLTGISKNLPLHKYTDKQRSELCKFLVEHREVLVQKGYDDMRHFLDMFTQMVDRLVENYGITPEEAFTPVMQASLDLI